MAATAAGAANSHQWSLSMTPHLTRLGVSLLRNALRARVFGVGQHVDDDAPHVARDNAKHFSVGLKPLTPGVYRVIRHATSVDTHKTEGAYQLSVKP
jgi:methionine-rich copper-binding protein CopC